MLKKAIIGQAFYKSMSKLADAEDAEAGNVFLKALTHDTATSGEEFIPTKWSADIIRELYERSWHRQIIPTLTMTSLKMKIPSFTTKNSAKYIGASIVSTDPANQLPLSSPTTSEVEIELKTLTINLMLDNKFMEYNASEQIETILKEDMINATMEAEINAIVNGDDSGTHMDSDITDADDVRKAFKGLRKLATGTAVDGANAEFDEDVLSKMLKSLGIYGQGRKNRCVFIGSPSVADQIRRNVEAVKTWDKYQLDATIFKGEIPPVYGVQFVESNFVREDLNASGVNDGVTETQTESILFNADEVFIGVPQKSSRTLKIKKWDDPRFDRIQLILLEDIGFQARHTDAIVVAYNVATAISAAS